MMKLITQEQSTQVNGDRWTVDSGKPSDPSTVHRPPSTTSATVHRPPSTPLLRPDATGLPCTIAGHVWVLPDYVPEPAAVWDAVYDQNALAGRYDHGDLRACAVRLLLTNYDLAPDDAVELVWSCDLAELVPPVELALFGPEPAYRSWSSWVRTSLLANGLSLRTVPAADLRGVLDQLVATGRAVPAEKWISAAEYRAYRTNLDDLVNLP
jgi:hypothetical protein